MEPLKKFESKRKKTKSYVSHKFSLQDGEDDIFCAKYCPEGNTIAFAWGDGKVRIANRKSQQIQILLANPKLDIFDQMPITCLRFRKTSKILISCSADGYIYYWHVKSGKLIHTMTEEDNQIYCMDYDATYAHLATGGKDLVVRVYDEDTKTVVTNLKRSGETYSGHSNRIFSVKFHPQNDNILISGGWDNVIYSWDVREGKAVNYFAGPNISGESIDIWDNQILAGSFNDSQNLCIFDIRKTNEPIVIATEKFNVNSMQIYSAMFSRPHNKYIFAGGAAQNEVRVMHNNEEKQYGMVSSISGLPTPCLTIDWHPSKDEFVFGWADGSLHVMGLHTY